MLYEVITVGGDGGAAQLKVAGLFVEGRDLAAFGVEFADLVAGGIDDDGAVG